MKLKKRRKAKKIFLKMILVYLNSQKIKRFKKVNLKVKIQIL